MQIDIPVGTYVIAISGGVDSVVLLDLLSKTDCKLIVAHLDHGIRGASQDDAAFVENLAGRYVLPFETKRVELGENASEATARLERYEFLGGIKRKYSADAVVTAHHQDDLLETAILNLLRGSGRRGLSSLRSRPGLLRPLLNVRKQELIDYANANNLSWREDETNSDTKYLRNKIRLQLLPRTDEFWRQAMLVCIARAHANNDKLDHEIDSIVSYLVRHRGAAISRSFFVKLPHDIAMELVYALLRRLGVHDIDAAQVERLSIAIKTAKIGAKADIDKTHYLLMTKRSVRIMHRETGKTAKL